MDLTAGELTVTPEKTENPLVYPMAGELREFLAILTAGVGKAPLFSTRCGRITGRDGGLSNEFGRLVQQAEVIRQPRSGACGMASAHLPQRLRSRPGAFRGEADQTGRGASRK